MVDLTNNIANHGIISCDEIVLTEVATFTGNNSYALLFESFSPINDFHLTLSFRSARADCNGLLAYFGNSSRPDYLAMELVEGAVSHLLSPAVPIMKIFICRYNYHLIMEMVSQQWSTIDQM